MRRPLICAFVKLRNEIIRGNLYRCLENLKKVSDVIVACDDASTDGTREHLQATIPAENLILVNPEDQDFRNELAVKQRMLERVHEIQPYFVLWADGDEEIPDHQIDWVRPFCEREKDNISTHGYTSHYVQLWRSSGWARLDDGFGDGHFVKLWRWGPNLSFKSQYGTHHQQFPEQIAMVRVAQTPWNIVHWGNYGKSLTWKCIQYHGGLGGVDRHLSFENAAYEQADALTKRPLRRLPGPKPQPFSPREKQLILSMAGLKKHEKWFTVLIPTFNRAAYLPTTLISLLNQSYPNWIALVLDDGSTDNTPEVMATWQERDPRIFYCRYDKMGAVAMNERGMSMAVEFTEFFTRLGSDDVFEPHKLRLDAAALSMGHDFVYGSYRVHRDGALQEICNLPEDSTELTTRLGAGAFAVSWANMACTTKLLAKVRDHYGSFCDSQLRNMEDFLVNYRLTRFAKPVWRGFYKSAAVIDPGPELQAQIAADRDNIRHDAMWRVNPVGASSDTVTTGSEDVLTRTLISEDMKKWTR